MLQAHTRGLLLQVATFASVITVTLIVILDPPIGVLTLSLMAVAAAILGLSIRLSFDRLRLRRLARNEEIKSLELQLEKQNAHNDKLEAEIAKAEAILDGRPEPLPLRTQRYDMIGEGVNARHKRLLREVRESAPPSVGSTRTKRLYDGRLVPVDEDLKAIAELTTTSYGRALLSEPAYDPDVPDHLDSAYEWESAHELGSADPIWYQGRCKHLSEFVEPVYLNDDPAGPLVARLCTKCNTQLPGEGDYA